LKSRIHSIRTRARKRWIWSGKLFLFIIKNLFLCFSPPPSSFITKDLLNEFDEAIAFSSSSIHDTLAHSSSSNSSTSGEKEESGKTKQSTAHKARKSGDRSRNASGIEKKVSREEGMLG
jgi:hypothetical protein